MEPQKSAQKKNWSDELIMGEYKIKNRFCLAAMTRNRCNPEDGIPTDLVAQYYAQRSGAGIVITQATAWSPRGHGFPGGAQCFNQKHVQGWKKVTSAVHQKRGLIFIQLFHIGRNTDPRQNGGFQIWGPSPIGSRQKMFRPFPDEPYPIPKQMTLEDIKITLQQLRKSVILAKEAGFDGIALHGAHGYLIDAFLRTAQNQRKDQYGGSTENRARFCLQCVDICLEFFKPWQLGIKFSPVSPFGDMHDQNPLETFSYVLKQLSKRNIGFVELRQSCQYYDQEIHYTLILKQQMENVCKTLRPFFNGILIANDSFKAQNGINYIRQGWADMISFGRLYISNPDLEKRIINNLPLNLKYNREALYGHQWGKVGYTDYIMCQQQ